MPPMATGGKYTLDFSIILPCYNEVDNLGPLLDELNGVMTSLAPHSFEVIAVDDGSTDGTLDVLRHHRNGIPQLRILRLRINQGQSAAFVAGFQNARGQWLITLDADGQNDPADIPRLLDAMVDCDACFGYRRHRQDRWSKRIGSRIANTIRNAVLGGAILDTGCSLKVFHARFVEHMTPWNGLHRFLPTLLEMQGARFRQLPVNHRPRRAGTSKYTNWGRLGRTLIDLLAVRWMQKRQIRLEVEPVA